MGNTPTTYRAVNPEFQYQLRRLWIDMVITPTMSKKIETLQSLIKRIQRHLCPPTKNLSTAEDTSETYSTHTETVDTTSLPIDNIRDTANAIVNAEIEKLAEARRRLVQLKSLDTTLGYNSDDYNRATNEIDDSIMNFNAFISNEETNNKSYLENAAKIFLFESKNLQTLLETTKSSPGVQHR